MDKLTFGKYKGATYEYVRKSEPSYMLWLFRNINNRLDKKLYNYIDSNIDEITIEARVERVEFLRELCDNEYSIEY